MKIIFLSANSSEIWMYCIPALYDPTRMVHKMTIEKRKLQGVNVGALIKEGKKENTKDYKIYKLVHSRKKTWEQTTQENKQINKQKSPD